MTAAQELVARAEQYGVSVSLKDGRPYVRPISDLPCGLLAELKAHKAELVSLLSPTPMVRQALGGVVEEEPAFTKDEVGGMELAEFARSKLVVSVRSEVLGEAVLFAGDAATVDPGERRAVYRGHELLDLLPLGPENLKHVHAVKKTFRGTVTDSKGTKG